MNTELVMDAEGISKSYPGVQALDSFNFNLLKGEVHAVVGENGAGKSTFIEILSGTVKPDKGIIRINGIEINSLVPSEASRIGIETVHQEDKLVENMTVAENIFLSDLAQSSSALFKYRKYSEKCKQLLKTLGILINHSATIDSLSQVDRKLVSIAKAMARKPSILILDEPTCALDADAKNILFSIIEENRKRGIGIIYISHHLKEVFQIADRVTVLKDGKKSGTADIDMISENELIQKMIGREISSLFRKRSKKGQPERSGIFNAVNVSGKNGVCNISFDVRRGEIFGIGGMVGSGRSELARLIFGLDRMTSGKLLLDDKVIRSKQPSGAISNGIGFVTESRKKDGLILSRSVLENISLVRLGKEKTPFINLPDEKRIALDIKDKINIKTPSLQQDTKKLSGGNQQKVVLAKWLNADFDILILDEPTVGIDLGARSEIYNLIYDIAAQGKIIILISSDMPELICLSDKVGVMRNGFLECILEEADITEENIMKNAIGCN